MLKNDDANRREMLELTEYFSHKSKIYYFMKDINTRLIYNL